MLVKVSCFVSPRKGEAPLNLRRERLVAPQGAGTPRSRSLPSRRPDTHRMYVMTPMLLEKRETEVKAPQVPSLCTEWASSCPAPAPLRAAHGAIAGLARGARLQSTHHMSASSPRGS